MNFKFNLSLLNKKNYIPLLFFLCAVFIFIFFINSQLEKAEKKIINIGGGSPYIIKNYITRMEQLGYIRNVNLTTWEFINPEEDNKKIEQIINTTKEESK